MIRAGRARVAAGVAALLLGGGCTPPFAQADPSDGVAINGTYTVFSDGQWAQTDQSYHDEASVTQTWTSRPRVPRSRTARDA